MHNEPASQQKLPKVGRIVLITGMIVWGVFALYINQTQNSGIGYQPQEVKIQYRKTSSPDGIEQVKGPAVKPVLYPKAISLKGLPVKEKKQKFVDLVLPAILVAKHRINEACKRVSHLLKTNTKISTKDSLWLNSQQKAYKADNPQALISKLKTHPTSIILGQAALECGWGTSRFFEKANNIFGVWSYNPNEPRIKASFMRGDKAVFVKKYKDLSGSVMDYFQTIARVPAYKEFREKRMRTTDTDDLLPLLKNYSELRGLYVKRLKNVIELNNFRQYDLYYIDPEFIKPDKNPNS